MKIKIPTFLKTLCLIGLFVLLSSCQNIGKGNKFDVQFFTHKGNVSTAAKHISYNTLPTNLAVTQLSWGGGGAFTHYMRVRNGFLLSSDVSGVWHKKNITDDWSPLNNGLGEYEVTAMHATDNGKVFLLTSKYLYQLSDKMYWIRLSPLIQTRRNEFSENIVTFNIKDQHSICILGSNNKVLCKLYDSEKWMEISFDKTADLNSVLFSPNGKWLFVGLNNELHSFDISTQKMSTLATFESKIQMFKLFEESMLIATNNALYEFNPINRSKQTVYSITNGKIKRFVCSVRADDCILGTEKDWSAKIIFLNKKNGVFIAEKNKPTFKFDTTLPYRDWRHRLSRTLSLTSRQTDIQELYLTDYWGAYYSLDGGKAWNEDVAGAVNTVGTDLLVKNEEIFVSTMDNGVVNVKNRLSKIEYNSIYPKSDGELAGHSWQMAADNENLFFTLSPWNTKKNFVGVYNFNEKTTTLLNAGLPFSKKSNQAFWAESYVRGIEVNSNYLSVISDGENAGLFSIKMPLEQNSASFNKVGNWRGQEKLYNAISTVSDNIAVASCNGTLTKLKVSEGLLSSSKMEAMNTKFCAFDMLSHGNALYLLGEKNRTSVVIKHENGRNNVLLQSEYGSAFKALAINPLRPQEMFAATISWSERSNSGAYLSNDFGKTWNDVTCILTHHNGVVSATFDESGDTIFILQKVGGLISLSSTALRDVTC
ncbi:hypothetical protein [Glaciecola sp. SC05]|uniref:hypothetical protein n=1 Tax=Glaciecola sp. SC05 TaxID=1987355 RepID=UPI003527A121